MPIVPAAEFMPDMPDVPAGASTDTAFNVVPLTPVSYGPLPSFAAYSTALNARCQGAISVTDTSGNARVFAGTSSKLYRMTSASTTPADVSKVGGYTTSASGFWDSTIFGSRVIFTNFTDAPQSYVEGSSALFADLIGTGTTDLKAKCVATVKDWVVFGNTTDGTFGNQPQRVWWTNINDPTTVPTPGTTAAFTGLSDYQDIPGQHGALQRIAGNLGTSNAGVFFERGVWRMIQAGLPDIFDFVPADGARGLVAPGAMTQLGGIAYLRSADGFYAFDGSEMVPIGKGKVDQFFKNDFQPNYLDRISAAADPTTGLIAFAYPGMGSTAGQCNRILFYAPWLNRWAATEANAVTIECLLRGATFGVSLDNLNSYGTIDTLPYTLDSPVWSGGLSVLSAFDTTHKFGYFNGPNMAAKVDTSDFEMFAGQQSVVNRVRPLVDSTGATIASCGRDTISAMPSYSTANAQEANGSVAVRSRGRYHRFRTATASGASFTHIGGVDVEDAQAVGGVGGR